MPYEQRVTYPERDDPLKSFGRNGFALTTGLYMEARGDDSIRLQAITSRGLQSGMIALDSDCLPEIIAALTRIAISNEMTTPDALLQSVHAAVEECQPTATEEDQDAIELGLAPRMP